MIYLPQAPQAEYYLLCLLETCVAQVCGLNVIIEVTELCFVQNSSHPTWSALNSDRNFQERGVRSRCELTT